MMGLFDHLFDIQNHVISHFESIFGMVNNCIDDGLIEEIIPIVTLVYF